MTFVLTRAPVAVSVVILCLSMTACSEIRKTTYPEYFHYLGRTDVQSAMHSLANGVVSIEALLKHTQAEGIESKPGADDRAISPQEESILVDYILEELDAMIAVTDTLLPTTERGVGMDKPLGRTNHLLIDEYLDEFTAEIVQAQLRLQANPPDYLALGRVLGSCSGCHRLR